MSAGIISALHTSGGYFLGRPDIPTFEEVEECLKLLREERSFKRLWTTAEIQDRNRAVLF